jgi:hypothetical protein
METPSKSAFRLIKSIFFAQKRKKSIKILADSRINAYICTQKVAPCMRCGVKNVRE